MRKTSARWLIAASIVAAVVAVQIVLRRRDGIDEGAVFVEEPSPPVPLPADRTGTPTDRGHRAAYALDMDRLREEAGFEPVVEYLTYVQSKRGEDSHLLFVRYSDLDVLARQEGEEVGTFLERLDQLGVVVSNN